MHFVKNRTVEIIIKTLGTFGWTKIFRWLRGDLAAHLMIEKLGGL